MAESNEWDDDFKKLVRNMSDDMEPSDEFLALIEKANILTLRKDEVQVKYLEALTMVNSALFLAILSGVVLGIAWSFYAWLR